jgi:N-acetylmuramoyl-L-alanine amidase
MKKKIVVIDPGHGGHDPGAVHGNLLKEKDVVLRVSRLIQEKLTTFYSDQVETHLTRDDDTYPSLSSRARISSALNADAFVSIHCNSAENEEARGFECFTTVGQNNSDKLAHYLLDSFAKEFPYRKMRSDNGDGDNDRERNFTVISSFNSAPSALFELEFIHNAQGVAFLSSEDSQERMADALVIGILAFLGIPTGSEDGDDSDDSDALLELSSRYAELTQRLEDLLDEFKI